MEGYYGIMGKDGRGICLLSYWIIMKTSNEMLALI